MVALLGGEFDWDPPAEGADTEEGLNVSEHLASTLARLTIGDVSPPAGGSFEYMVGPRWTFMWRLKIDRTGAFRLANYAMAPGEDDIARALRVTAELRSLYEEHLGS